MSGLMGFGSKQQQRSYLGVVLDIVEVLQRRIIKFYSQQEADQHRFKQVVNFLFRTLFKMEESQHLEHKISPTFNNLLQFINKQAEIVEPKALPQPTISIDQSKEYATLNVAKLNLRLEKEKTKKDKIIGFIRHQPTPNFANSFKQTGNPEEILQETPKPRRSQSTNISAKLLDLSRQSQTLAADWECYYKQACSSGLHYRSDHSTMPGYMSKSFHRRFVKRN